MLQQVMTNPGEIIFREVPVPEVKENQVLVKIMNIGICGSDIHVYHGKHPFTKYPVTQGHEVSGEITELGKNVTEFHVGQKVTIEPQVYCGHCYPCEFLPKLDGKRLKRNSIKTVNKIFAKSRWQLRGLVILLADEPRLFEDKSDVLAKDHQTVMPILPRMADRIMKILKDSGVVARGDFMVK